VEEPPVATEPPAELESAPTLAEKLPPWQRFMPFLPWLSLAVSVTESIIMDRNEQRAAYVAGASAVSWLVLIVVTLLHRPRADTDQRTTGMFHKAMRFTTVAANQSLVHVSLFFCAPLYAQVFAWTPLEVVFAIVYIVAIGISLWDPLCEHVLLQPLFGPMFLAFSSFVGWNAVLPMLGIQHNLSVWISAGAVSLVLPLVQVISGVPRKRLLGGLAVSLLLPLLLLLGGVRALPPAPLGLVVGAIGTRVEERELVDPTQHFAEPPPALVCFTSIRAPFGLREALMHEWRRDGQIVRVLELEVRGGRKAGFRTWSRLPLSPHDRGAYSCNVVTKLGQVVGIVRVTVGSW
jgi:hypothetical protein